MAGLKLGGHPHLTIQLFGKQQHLVYVLGNFIILFKYNLVWQNHRFSIIMFITKVEYMWGTVFTFTYMYIKKITIDILVLRIFPVTIVLQWISIWPESMFIILLYWTVKMVMLIAHLWLDWPIYYSTPVVTVAISVTIPYPS